MLFNPLNKYLGGDSRTSSVKKNILWSFGIKGISIIISLMLVPLTLGYVSAELYGVWLTLSSVVVWLGFFDIGFTQGLKNKLAEAIALGDYKRGKALVSTTYVMMVVIFVPISLLFYFCIPYINWAEFLNVGLQFNEEIIRTMRVLSVFICLQMVVNILTSVAAAFQKVALSSAFPVIGNSMSLLLIYILTKTVAPSLVSLAFAISGVPILVFGGASILLYNKGFKKVAPNLRYFDKGLISDLFGLGVKFFIIQIQIIVLYQTTNFLISNISSPLQVTEYNIAYKYLSVCLMAYNIILSPLWPAFTDAYTKKDYVWMNNIYKKMIKIYIYCAMLVLLMVFISPIFYDLWIGNKAEIPISMTIIVAVYLLLHNWDSLQVQLINGIGTIKLQTYVTLIGLCLHIPLSYLLGKYLGLEARGVVLSMVFVNFTYCIFFTIQIRKILNKKASGIWLK